MYDPYTQNAFRVLGLAAEVEPALLPSWMEPRHLPPLWKVTWLSEPERTAEAVARAMQSLQNPSELLMHYRTWFRKETPLDQRAFKAIEDGYWEGAADLWKGRAEAGDEGALQNLAVLYHSRALSSSQGATPVWAYWTRALEWSNRLVLTTLDDPTCADVRERIVEDLVELAHHQASRNSAEDVRLVLDIFRRAGLPQKRREQLEEDLLSLELTRLRHACNRLKETLPSAFRVGDHLSERNAETLLNALDNEIYPVLEWLQKAQPGGHLEQEARKEVALLLRSLSRAVRGKVENGDLGFMARAVAIAPDGFHGELLEGQEAPLPDAPKEAAPAILEDSYHLERGQDDPPPPPPRRSPLVPLVVALLALFFLAGAGLVVVSKRHQAAVAAQRRVLEQQWNEGIDEAARVAKQLAEAHQKAENTRKALARAPAGQKAQLQQKLDVLVQQEMDLGREHEEALARLAELKDKLARTK